MEKWVTLAKLAHTSKNNYNFEKWVTLGNMGHNWRNGSHFKKNGLFLKE